MSVTYIQVHFRQDFFMEANMNPEQSDLGPYCLQYRLPKNMRRQEKQMRSHDWGTGGGGGA